MILEAILNTVSVGKQNYEIMIDDLCSFFAKCLSSIVLHEEGRSLGVEVMQKSMRKFCAFKDCSDCLTQISTLKEYTQRYTVYYSSLIPLFPKACVQSSITSSLHMCH